jgi:hypothetical protein
VNQREPEYATKDQMNEMKKKKNEMTRTNDVNEAGEREWERKRERERQQNLFNFSLIV